MKKFICLLLSLLLFCGSALAEKDRITRSDESWIDDQALAHSFCESLPDEGETTHLLWDIPFGVSVGDFLTLASDNANVNLYLETGSTAYLAIEDPSSVSLFGHPLRQSYFGFLNLKQDIGLTAGQVSGSAEPGYIYAALRLYNGIDDISLSQAMDCFKTIFDAMCELYGEPTRTFYFDPTYSYKDTDMYAFPVLNEDGSLNEAWLLASLENAPSSIINSTASVYWSNVKLELSKDYFNCVSLYYPPSETVWVGKPAD